MTERISATDIRAAMSAKFAPPEWAIMWEVGNATGFAQKRWADAVMMSIWPSRGLELHGVEIKVSTSDWKREAADPRKAEEIGQYCDRWWVHTAPGVVKDLAEVPPAWGLREWDGKRWSTKREAVKNASPTPLTRGFLAALLRRADGDERARIQAQARQLSENAQKALEDERAKITARVESEVERRTAGFQKLSATVAAFEEASGLKLAGLWDGDTQAREIGLLVAAIRQSGLVNSWGGLAMVRRELADMAESLEKAIAESGLPIPIPSPKRVRA